MSLASLPLRALLTAVLAFAWASRVLAWRSSGTFPRPKGREFWQVENAIRSSYMVVVILSFTSSGGPVGSLMAPTHGLTAMNSSPPPRSSPNSSSSFWTALVTPPLNSSGISASSASSSSSTSWIHWKMQLSPPPVVMSCASPAVNLQFVTCELCPLYSVPVALLCTQGNAYSLTRPISSVTAKVLPFLERHTALTSPPLESEPQMP
mmetsp:Transcript_1345/g.2351  ORF Transcript_1345/g.2351 Transcript_1345/m.2351 type:complete len:207 (-) Transcript_1345:3061-3681(-)